MEEPRRTGTVYLIGAGPGDAGLITVKGLECLKQVQHVIYETNVSESVLSLLPLQVRAEAFSMRDVTAHEAAEQIVAKLCKQAAKGQSVAFLGSGDSFFYGASALIAQQLERRKVPYQVVPGVSSVIGTAEYSGVPLVHEDYTTAVHIFAATKEGKAVDLPFDAIAKLDGTLVFHMAWGRMQEISDGLIHAGVNPMLPATYISDGTTADQRQVRGTVRTIAEDVKKSKMDEGGELIVGYVCALSDQMNWRKRLPLHGKRIFLVSAREENNPVTVQLRNLGAQVISFSTVSSRMRKVNRESAEIFKHIQEYQYLLFTSNYGVHSFFAQFVELGLDVRRLADVKICAAGRASQVALQEHGLQVDYMPNTYGVEALGEMIGKLASDQERILAARASNSGRTLYQAIRRGTKAYFNELSVYDHQYVQPDWIVHLPEYQNPKAKMHVVFMSGAAVQGFVKCFPGHQMQSVTAYCRGSQTEAIAKRYGMDTRLAQSASVDGMMALLRAEFPPVVIPKRSANPLGERLQHKSDFAILT